MPPLDENHRSPRLTGSGLCILGGVILAGLMAILAFWILYPRYQYIRLIHEAFDPQVHESDSPTRMGSIAFYAEGTMDPDTKMFARTSSGSTPIFVGYVRSGEPPGCSLRALHWSVDGSIAAAQCDIFINGTRIEAIYTHAYDFRTNSVIAPKGESISCRAALSAADSQTRSNTIKTLLESRGGISPEKLNPDSFSTQARPVGLWEWAEYNPNVWDLWKSGPEDK